MKMLDDAHLPELYITDKLEELHECEHILVHLNAETWPRDTLGHVHESEIIVSLSDISAPAASDEISR